MKKKSETKRVIEKTVRDQYRLDLRNAAQKYALECGVEISSIELLDKSGNKVRVTATPS